MKVKERSGFVCAWAKPTTVTRATSTAAILGITETPLQSASSRAWAHSSAIGQARRPRPPRWPRGTLTAHGRHARPLRHQLHADGPPPGNRGVGADGRGLWLRAAGDLGLAVTLPRRLHHAGPLR